MSSDRSLDAVGDSTPSRLFWIDCVMEYQTRLRVLSRCIWLLIMSCVTGSRGGVPWYLKKLSVGFRTVRGGEGSPFCSGLLGVGDCNSVICAYHVAFRCSALRAPSTFFPAARQSLICPPHASEIGEAYLISPSAALGVDSPHRRLLLFQYIGPDCFLQTGYLPVLADSVRAPTALIQVNLPALARLHYGFGDCLRALLLGSLFRCWVHLYD